MYTHHDKVAGTNGLGVGSDGDEIVVADELGGLYQKGNAIAASAEELNRAPKKVTGALVAVDTAGGVFSFQNPEDGDIIIDLVEVIVGTIATAACTIDVGTTTTNATTSSDNMLDGADVHGATGTLDNLTNGGTNGKTRQRLASGKFLNASVASGASAGLVGTYLIEYRKV